MTLAAVGAVVGIVGAGAGIYQGFKGASDAKKAQGQSDALFAQRKAYKTPSEVFDVFNQAQNNAQSGYDPTTLGYLTSQTNNATNAALDTSKLLGGDPNSFANLIDQNFQQIFKVGSENNLLKMKKFDQLLNATNLIIGNKDAEFASQDNLLKDQLQAAAQRTQVGRQNEQSGINLALNGFSSLASNSLFKTPNNSTNPNAQQVSSRDGVAYQQPLSYSLPTTPTVNTNFNIQPQ